MRYYFNVDDGQQRIDAVGQVFPSREAAQREATRAAGQHMMTSSGSLCRGGEWTMTVTDATGLTLFALHVVSIVAPAGRPLPSP